MRTFVGITGTTSVGKSAVAVQLAKRLGTEIISADSMQVYKGMDLGTAKITPQQMQGVVHHMIDIVEPTVDFSAYLYRQEASRIIDAMPSLPIVAGGTGFYFDSILYPPEFGCATAERHAELCRIYQTEGLEPLVRMLCEADPASAKIVDCRNYKRVIRAIEIAESGQSRAEGHGHTRPLYDMRLFVLQRNRAQLYSNIEHRVDEMVQNGLVEEVRSLVAKYGYIQTPAFEAIGYKEMISFLKNDISLPEAIEQVKINTRHYAKKQITYYKRMNVAEYIDVDGKTSEEIADHIYERIKSIA